MHERYRMFRRAGGTFYARDKVTGKGESLKTEDKATARQLLVAMNQAVAQPQLNRSLAKAYLSAKSPELLTRTWADVMHHYVVTGVVGDAFGGLRMEGAALSRLAASQALRDLLSQA